jgi:hypothetical protein
MKRRSRTITKNSGVLKLFEKLTDLNPRSAGELLK